MAVALIGLIFFFCFLSYRIYVLGRRRYFVGKIPGPSGIPIFGNIFNFLVPIADLWGVVHGMNDDYYPTYKITTPLWTVLNLRHPDDAEILLSSTQHITKSALYDFLHPWFKTGLLTSTGGKWQKRRKILTPAFHFNVLREFVNVFDEEGRRMVRDLKNAGEKEHDLLPLVTKYTLNTICETAMGTSLEGMTKFHTKYRNAVHEMGNYLLHRLLRPWLHPPSIFNLSPTGRKQKKALEIIHAFSNKIIRERQEYHKESGKDPMQQKETFNDDKSGKKRLAMLDLLIAAKNAGHMDEPGIREEVDTFIFEGHDTTGMGIAFILLLLAEHKDVQEKARDEIDAVLDGSGGKMEPYEIQQFQYLDCCIKESLRLYPSVPLISRYIKEDLHLKNYLIPGGVVAHIHIYDLHRDPNFWPDPDTFDPDRFLPEHCVGRHPFSYIPFSAGPRNCIGQKFAMFELKALIGHVLRNFYLEPIDLASRVRLLPDLVLRPAHPIRIKFVPRKL
ncbi:cytochrome P450 4C1-like [Venturia canescens]|uniref:cytochrome P450 4C1-like n=1 Tax=Venturia canescens TaxID=32260 RepID=UPI001C9D4B5B|nr:cytochrome P450 4C1-like [Venturia canescens]